jgi:hypothetical protein
MSSDCNAAGHSYSLDPPNQTDQLTALAHEARLLEIGLESGGEAARQLVIDLERALTTAMDAESPGELTQARTAIGLVLGTVLSQGLCLSAELADMEVKGVLGMSRMSVLTAVLRAPR